MAIPWELIAPSVGFLYGALAPGKQDKVDIIKRAVFIGVVLGLLFAVVGSLTGQPAYGPGGVAGAFLSFAIMAVLFVVGVWLGDLLELAIRKRHEGPDGGSRGRGPEQS